MNKERINRAIIMHNYTNPSQWVDGAPENYLNINAKIDSCSDNFIIYIKINDEKIEDVLFSGEGCAISTSSLNLIATYLINKKRVEAIELVKKYRLFVMGKNIDETNLHDLVVFKNIHKHLNRINCGLIGANHILIMLGNND